MSPRTELVEVDAQNWAAVADLEVDDAQRSFVAPVSRYLCMALYEGIWNPLAIVHDGAVVGHVMWGFDAEEGAHWIGGAVIDVAQQGKGVGRRAIELLIERLTADEGASEFALSYHPENQRARGLYRSLGFVETGELAEDEIVARTR